MSPRRPPRSGDFLRSLKLFYFKRNPDWVPLPFAGEAGTHRFGPGPPGILYAPLTASGWRERRVCGGAATYLLLGPAELLLHLLGEQAGGASRLALRHPAGSGRPGPAACGFLEAPEEEVRFPACLASGRGCGGPAPRRSRPPRLPRLLRRWAPHAAAVVPRPPGPVPLSPGLQGGRLERGPYLFRGGGWKFGTALRWCSLKTSLEAVPPGGMGAPAPKNSFLMWAKTHSCP